MNDIATLDRRDTLPASAPGLTPMEMMDRAIANGAGVEVLEKLMGLQERFEKNQARKAFDAAIAAAKAELPEIIKNATGHNNKRYADFAAIARAINPILSKHGLSYRFRSHQDDRVHVTCVLAHSAGHSEEATIAGPPDKSGNKNDIQAIGSTLTYLQRYSLTQMLGLASSEDDDGRRGGSEPITDDQRAELQALIDDTGSDIRRFCAAFGISAVADLPSASYQRAIQMLNAKKKGAK